MSRNGRKTRQRNVSLSAPNETESIVGTTITTEPSPRRVDNESPTTSAHLGSKSETVSYRDKIRERFKLIKEQVASTPKIAKPVDFNTALKLLKEENSAVESSLDRYRSARSSDYSTAESYNFFCENIDPGCNLVSSEATFKDEEDDNGYDSALTKCVSPSLLQEFVDIAQEEHLWRPKRSNLSRDNKILTDHRILSDEGLFVSETPKIAYLNSLEQRLVLDEDTKWFNSDGNLKVVDNPTSNSSYKPIISEDEIETKYIMPYQDGNVKHGPTVLIRKHNVLQLNILTAKFQHHPLFSVEHIFETKLISLFKEYQDKTQSQTIDRLTKRLYSLRAMRDSDKQMQKASGDHFKHGSTNEIKKLRELLIEESTDMRQLTKDILETWKNIKTIRKLNEFSNTMITLIIYKEKSDYRTDLRNQEKEIENMVSEIVAEQKTDYEELLTSYREELNKWKQVSGNNEKRPKKPSIEFDEDDIRHDVANTIKQAFRPPGEPILTFNLTNENEITKQIENKNEVLRRQAVKSTKIYFRIYYNNIEVCKSKIVHLNDNFECFFEENLSIQVNDVPHSLNIDLFEIPTTLLKRKIAQVSLKLPHLSNRSMQEEICMDLFTKDELIHYKHEGVGSGVELKTVLSKYSIATSDDVLLKTNGCLLYNICWEESNVKEKIEEKLQYQEVLDEDGHIDIAKLTNWANTSNVDPQNPNNAFVFEYIDACVGNQHVSDSPKIHFRCNPEMQKLTFYDPSKIDTNIRFQVLQLRNKNEPEFLAMYVPNRLKEIPVNILAGHNQRRKQEQLNFSLDSDDNDNIDVKRSIGMKYLGQLHTRVYQQCRCTQNNLTYDNVVNEKMISYFQNWIKIAVSNFLNWFKIRPGMNKPLPKLASAQSEELIIAPINTSASKIIIQVKSAINLPHKILPKKQARTRSISVILEDQEPHVFLEVKYENMALSTSVHTGNNPKWDEQLIFPLRNKHIDYMNPDALKGSIMINVFNENNVKDLDKKVTDWFGYIKIPISAIAYADKMTGFFQVVSPGYLNYEQHPIYVELNIFMEPNFPKLNLDIADLPTSEPPYIQKHVLHWNRNFNNNYPHRQFSAMVIGILGKTVCITRFIKPLEPPQTTSNDFETTPEQCARYVSLIPFINCNKLYHNICLCTEEMFKIYTGTILDHAIALTCYLLALDIEAWLLLGYGIPNGQAGYVLAREYGPNNIPSHYVYDVTTANRFNVTDIFCPLQRIFCVVNDQNIWANTQRTNDVTLTQFDFMKRSDWLPLFNNEVTAPSNSIQKKVNYQLDSNINGLENLLETKLKKKIIKYRKTERTIWNHSLSNQFKQYLQSFETNYAMIKHDFSHIKTIDHMQQLHGFILDLPYTSFTALFEMIKSSMLFSVDVPSYEFVLSLHLHKYSNDIIVLWLVIGFVLPK